MFYCRQEAILIAVTLEANSQTITLLSVYICMFNILQTKLGLHITQIIGLGPTSTRNSKKLMPCSHKTGLLTFSTDFR